jgi:hypothetical protein
VNHHESIVLPILYVVRGSGLGCSGERVQKNLESLCHYDDAQLIVTAGVLLNEDFYDRFLRVKIGPTEATVECRESIKFTRLCQQQ